MGSRVLVVEDDHSLADLLKMKLEHLGHVFTLASNQREAYHLLGEQQFDFALLDLRLPTHEQDMNPNAEVGFHILAYIRDRFSPKELPVIVMTAFEETSQTAVRALLAKANEYITKPFSDSPVSLESKIAAIVHQIERSNDEDETKRKHRIVWTNESFKINEIEVVKPSFKKLLVLLASRALLPLNHSDDDPKQHQMTGHEIAAALGIKDSSVRQNVRRFRTWINGELKNSEFDVIQDNEIIRNDGDWQGYDLNFETCAIVRE